MVMRRGYGRYLGRYVGELPRWRILDRGVMVRVIYHSDSHNDIDTCTSHDLYVKLLSIVLRVLLCALQ